MRTTNLLIERNTMNSARAVLLPNQRKLIVEAIVGAGLSPSNFEWSDVASEHRGDHEHAVLIKHRAKDYYCRIDRTQGSNWKLEHCPGSETEWNKKLETSWGHAPGYIKVWAQRVAAELEAEDYIQLAIDNRQLLELPDLNTVSVPLSANERDSLVERLDALESYLLGIRSDSAEYQAQVRASMEFLKDHARRSDRRSIYGLVFSTLLAIGLQFLRTCLKSHFSQPWASSAGLRWRNMR